jgi:hypothetical protein
MIIAKPRPAAREEDPGSAIAKAMLREINRGIREGSLLAENNLAADQLAESGVAREIGKAGYYAALAAYCNQTRSLEETLAAPFKSGNHRLDQYFRHGWNAGVNRGLAIAREVQARLHDLPENER